MCHPGNIDVDTRRIIPLDHWLVAVGLFHPQKNGRILKSTRYTRSIAD
jgi:hypothetical protein